MELDALAITLDLTDGDNGFFYKQTDGFIFTFKENRSDLEICVNLPEISNDEKKTVFEYLNDTALYLKAMAFSKNGIIINFVSEIFDDTEYILSFIKSFSAFLSTEGLDFSNTELNVTFNKDMFIFAPVAREIEDDELMKKPKDKKDLAYFLAIFKKSTQRQLIAAFAVTSIIYGLLNIWFISVSSVVGYFMGWISSQLMLKVISGKKVYVLSMILTAISLFFATLFSVLYLFLSQTELYTFIEFSTQSLTVVHCLFNMVIAFILSLFGVYSTVPAKKKKPTDETEIEDF
ncbi:MAG: hypothetical protein IKB86_04360 [Clostridia bacterium]|nr:hypothetical protein [Clostridia bacterium]